MRGRILAVVLGAALLPSLVAAESLAAAAKKEQERRKKAQAAATAEAKVVDGDALAAPREGKGTFTGSSGPAASPAEGGVGKPIKREKPASEAGGSSPEIEAKRGAARQRVESSYGRISSMAGSFVEGIEAYENCIAAAGGNQAECQAYVPRLGSLAVAIADAMEEADDDARMGWLDPGEVRAVRERYGMDDSSWDRLVRFVAKYR